jgi:hypothetical protein
MPAMPKEKMLRARLAIVVTALAAACGGSTVTRRDVPPKDHPDAASAGAGDDAGASRDRDGGVSTAAGGTSSHIGAESGGVIGAGGATSNAGAPVAPGGSSGASGGAQSQSGGTGGRNPEEDAGSPLIDPHAEARRDLAQTYCTACGGGDPSCASSHNIEWYRDVPDGCWDELTAAVACSLENGCSPISGGYIGMGACLDERTAFGACAVGQSLSGKITGTSGTCVWNRDSSSTSCLVQCVDDPYRWYDSDCTGPPGGPFSCWCRLNGRVLSDSLVLNGAQFFSDTCSGAAELMTSGHCQKFVSCCYTFRGPPLEGLPEQDLCECTSDPSAGNFATCADVAASLKDGKVVDLCPRYEM